MDSVTGGQPITEDARHFHGLGLIPLPRLMAEAAALRDAGHGNQVSYSRKVFVPLTRLCRDVCAYCTFTETARDDVAAYLSADEVLAIARAGVAAGCHEVLFTLGDKPELRYDAARRALDQLGHETTISYLAEMCALVLDETGLLPHANPGVVTMDELAALRGVTVSQGLMLESASERLCQKGGPHFGSPDKAPGPRLETIRAAGELSIPFTSGILIGIGENRRERIESLLALATLHAEFGHIQEIIIQNFRAKAETRMESSPEPDTEELVWTIAMARLIFDAHMNIQAPPNLSPGAMAGLIGAGINDWGGVSPVTPDHVNPEYVWPRLEELARQTGGGGKELVERLAIYPAMALDGARWLDGRVRPHVLRAMDTNGLARTEPWSPGTNEPIPAAPDIATAATNPNIAGIIDRATQGADLSEAEIETLFGARGGDFTLVCRAADALRREAVGNDITYVVTRNINYTNICSFSCRFCAFSKGRASAYLRGTPYDLPLDEISRRAWEAWQRGATELCLQGGIHPDYTGDTYLKICAAVKEAAPGIHVHAFSPLEIHHGAATLGVTVAHFLGMLKDAGLGSLPGTAAEILDDQVRREICPDKLTTAQWLEVMEAAHGSGLASTSTIMFGHMETSASWARHLLHLRTLQKRTGMITEFVPLPFVHMEAPIYLKGRARRGPTFREAVLMHAVARLALHPVIANIQVSWVKLGADGAAACLDAGANDLGGTLMNESISRAAGTIHGEEFSPRSMENLISGLGRTPRQRTTLYGDAPSERRTASMDAAPLTVART